MLPLLTITLGFRFGIQSLKVTLPVLNTSLIKFLQTKGYKLQLFFHSATVYSCFSYSRFIRVELFKETVVGREMGLLGKILAA